MGEGQAEQFDRQIKARFGKDWDAAWADAVSIIRGSQRRDLDIRSRFFNNVYMPGRDLLVERWSSSGDAEAMPAPDRRQAA